MNERPTIVLLGASPKRQALAVSSLENVAVVVTGAAALAPAAARSPCIVLVDLAVPELEAALRSIEDVRATVPRAQIVALAASKDPDLILRAMRAGAREFVVLGEDGALATIIVALVQRSAEEQPRGKIISIFPAKGGTGATTLATNLAGALHAEERRVLVVDFDRQLGDVLVFLDMTSGYTTQQLILNVQRLDRELLLSSVARHASGVYVLGQAHSLEEVEPVKAAEVPLLLQYLGRHFDYVVCDGLSGFDDLSVAVLDASDDIELLLTQDVPSLKNAKQCLEVFKRLDYGDRKVSLVVNRFHKGAAIDLPAISENLACDARCTLANDHSAAMEAVNKGVLLREAAPRSRLTKDIEQLASIVSGVAPKPRGGFFSSLFGRRDVSPTIAKPQPVKQSNKDEGVYDESRRAPETS